MTALGGGTANTLPLYSVPKTTPPHPCYFIIFLISSSYIEAHPFLSLLYIALGVCFGVLVDLREEVLLVCSAQSTV